MKATPQLDATSWMSPAAALRRGQQSLHIRHRAEKQALMDLLNQLEQSIDEPTPKAVADAREAVAKDMGW
jgi:hypothetical protein